MTIDYIIYDIIEILGQILTRNFYFILPKREIGFCIRFWIYVKGSSLFLIFKLVSLTNNIIYWIILRIETTKNHTS